MWPCREKWFDGYDSSTGDLLDGKRYENWPKDDFRLSIDLVQKDIVDSAKIAADLNRTVEFRVNSDYGVQKMQEALDTYNRGTNTPISNLIIRRYP